MDEIKETGIHEEQLTPNTYTGGEYEVYSLDGKDYARYTVKGSDGIISKFQEYTPINALGKFIHQEHFREVPADGGEKRLVPVHFDEQQKKWVDGLDPKKSRIGYHSGPDTVGWFTFKTDANGVKQVELHTLSTKGELVPGTPVLPSERLEPFKFPDMKPKPMVPVGK